MNYVITTELISVPFFGVGLFLFVFGIVLLKRSQLLATDLQKFKLAVEDTSDQIVFTDPALKVVYANKATERNTGFGRKEIIGKSPIWWEQQVDSDFYKLLWEAVKIRRVPFVGQLFNRRKNNQQYLAEIRISPIVDRSNNLQFLVYLERDITEQKKLEEARSSFISTASHQLRTPLTSMRWFSEMLLEESAGKLNEEQKHYATRVYEGIERMIALLNLLLQTARVEAGRVKIEPVQIQLQTIATEIITSLKERADRRNIKITSEFGSDLPTTAVDHDIFWQVLQNILQNAIIYSHEGGKVSVSVVFEKNKKQFLFSVRDRGIGIPAEQQGRIFQKFFRADNAMKHSPEGSGLGLSLVKRMIGDWGGRIWFESKENEGTTFYFTVPEKGMEPRLGEIKLSV